MDANKLIKYLKQQPLFKQAPEAALAKIAGRVRVHQFNKGDIVLRQGATSNSLFIIRTGWVKVVTIGPNGEEVVLNHVGPGQVVGEMALLDRKPRSGTVVVLRPAQVLEIQYDDILQTINRHPALALCLLQEMFDRVRFASAYIEESIDWCRHMAEGNYDFVENQVEQPQSPLVDMSQSDHARASSFLSVFFKMVQGIKNREATLKQQVHQLSIQIDEARREKAVAELTDTQFFEELQQAAQRVRQERETKQKRPPKQHDEADT